jgi:TolB protein
MLIEFSENSPFMNISRVYSNFFKLSSRSIAFLAAGLLLCMLLTIPLFAQTTIVVSDPGRKFPIAVPQLCLQAGVSQATQEIPKTIAKDLDLSGYFEVLNPNSYVEAPGKCVPPDAGVYEDWHMIKAQWLVRGVVVAQGSKIQVQLYLHDVPGQRAVVGKEYEGEQGDAAKIAHRFANEIMKYVTGELGPFGSQVVYSSRVGRFKDLYVMDMDGSNIRQLTNDRGLSLSPAWDPAGRYILYTTYRKRVPDLYIIDVITGRSRPITNNAALEVGGTFTQDGTRVITSVSESMDSSLVMYGLDGKMIKTLTPPNRSIDVSPTISPDGSKLAFCSDRGGKPQIYVMPAEGGPAQRVSFVSSDYCTSPAWSPKGDRLAYVCRFDGGFQMFLSSIDGANPVQLTVGGDNEDPTWSPDGRYLIYASTMGKRYGFNLAMMRVVKNLEGTNIKQLTFNRGDDTEPSWGPRP